MNKNTPKQFVIQLGALIALYVSITSLIILLFSIINLRFPDEAAYVFENDGARTAIRTCMAVLIVFFPTYLTLTRISNQTRRTEMSGEYTTLTRWLIYISLLVAGGVLLGDLVTLINYFLNGEITTRFLFKVLALLLVVGTSFHYYLLDVRGYFTNRAEKAMYFAMGAMVLVLVSLVFGYQYIEKPSEVRERRFDEQQLTDLQQMQSTIENYFNTNNTLPSDIATAFGPFPVPEAPTGRDAYQYKVTSDAKYQLCATFAQASTDTEMSYTTPEPNYSWLHKAGSWCFDREIIPTPKQRLML